MIPSPNRRGWDVEKGDGKKRKRKKRERIEHDGQTAKGDKGESAVIDGGMKGVNRSKLEEKIEIHIIGNVEDFFFLN